MKSTREKATETLIVPIGNRNDFICLTVIVIGHMKDTGDSRIIHDKDISCAFLQKGFKSSAHLRIKLRRSVVTAS